MHQERFGTCDIVEHVSSCLICGGPQRLVFSYREFEYHRCSADGLVTTLPIPTDTQIENHYAAKFRAGNYSTRVDLLWQYEAVNREYADLLDRLVPKKGRVLDIGCFTGEFPRMMLGRGWDAYGVELQTEAVQLANQRIPGRVFQSNVFGNKLPHQQFEAVSLLAVIEHVTDPLALLRRCRDLLSPGGVFLLETPDSGSLLARLLGRFWPPCVPVEHIYLFSDQAMVSALQVVGFKDIGVQRHVKWLTIEYVYRMLETFGPTLYKIMRPLFSILPTWARHLKLPFYVGEMIVTARK